MIKKIAAARTEAISHGKPGFPPPNVVILSRACYGKLVNDWNAERAIEAGKEGRRFVEHDDLPKGTRYFGMLIEVEDGAQTDIVCLFRGSAAS